MTFSVLLPHPHKTKTAADFTMHTKRPPQFIEVREIFPPQVNNSFERNTVRIHFTTVRVRESSFFFFLFHARSAFNSVYRYRYASMRCCRRKKKMVLTTNRETGPAAAKQKGWIVFSCTRSAIVAACTHELNRYFFFFFTFFLLFID